MTPYKSLISTVALFLVASAARAELTAIRSDDGNLTVYGLTVTPAVEPQPALKHHLIIPDIDTQPGNSVSYYYRAMLAADRHVEAQRKTYGDAYDDWCTTGADTPALKDLPLDK